MKRNYLLSIIAILLVFPGLIFAQQEKYLRGVAAMNQNEYAAAVDFFTDALKTSDIKPLVFLARGKANIQLGKTDDAIKDFMDAEKLKPGIASYELAKCYAKLGNIENTVYYMRLHLESPYKVLESEIKKDLILLETDKKRDGAMASYFGLTLLNPYLEQDFVEFSLTMPAELKLKDGIEKYFMRKWGEMRNLPIEIVNRPKKAFQYSTGLQKKIHSKQNLE